MIPSQRHNQFFLECKHKALRDIYTRLSYDNNTWREVTIQHMLQFSNLLFGYDILSPYELSYGLSPSLRGKLEILFPEAHHELKSKRKLKTIFFLEHCLDRIVHVGDLIDVLWSFIIRSMVSSSWTKLWSYDPKSRSVTYASRNCETANATIEDIRPSLADNFLAM